MLGGFIASLGMRALLRGWRDRRSDLPLAARRKRRLIASLANLTVNLAALATFLVVTYVMLGQTDVTLLGRRVAGDILLAIASGRSVTALSRAILAPENARRRLVHMDDAAAREAERWVACCSALASTAISVLPPPSASGLPWTVHSFPDSHSLFFVVAALAIRAIYRLRAYLGAAIERWGAASGPGLARVSAVGVFSAVGHHVLAGGWRWSIWCGRSAPPEGPSC